MTAFHPIRQLRDAVSQIGSAVNASEEYSRAATETGERRRAARGNTTQDWARYIPL